jgi:hypothetical protein
MMHWINRCILKFAACEYSFFFLFVNIRIVDEILSVTTLEKGFSYILVKSSDAIYIQ